MTRGTLHIGDALVAARLIGSSREFTDEVTRLEASSALIPGTYTFQGGSTPEELVRAIMAGPTQVGDTLAVPLMQVGHLQNKTDDAAPDCSPLRRHTARHTHRKAVLQVRRTAFL